MKKKAKNDADTVRVAQVRQLFMAGAASLKQAWRSLPVCVPQEKRHEHTPFELACCTCGWICGYDGKLEECTALWKRHVEEESQKIEADRVGQPTPS
jgi:hypothetical protein